MTSPARTRRARRHLAWPVALIALAIVATAYATCIDRQAISDADREARSRDVLPSFRLEEVTHVDLAQGITSFRLDRAPSPSSSWVLTADYGRVHEPADPAAVDALLRELELAKRVRDLPAGDAFEGNPPRVRGEIAMGALHFGFEVGGDAARPAGGATMRVSGEGAFVIGPTLKVQLLRAANAYRQRALVPIGASDVARVRVASPSGEFLLVRNASSMRVSGPEGLRASRAVVDRIFGALADLRIEQFLSDADSPDASGGAAGDLLAAPALSWSIDPRDAARPSVRVVVLGPCPNAPGQVLLERAPPQYVRACAGRSSVDTLRAVVDEAQPAGAGLVDARVLVSHADEVEEVRLQSDRGGARVEIARKANGWRERAPDDRDLSVDESESASALVLRLEGAEAFDVRAGPPPDFAARTRATILRTGTGAAEVLELAAPDAHGNVEARRLDDGAWLRLRRDAARGFEPHPVALKPRSLWAAPVDPARVVGIDDSCTPTPEHLERKAGRWAFRAASSDLPVDSAAADDLANAVGRMRVDGWVDETDDGTFGFAPPKGCNITLTLAPGDDGKEPGPFGLAFGTSAGGERYAHALGQAAVFSPPAASEMRARHPAIDGQRMRVDPTLVSRVEGVRAGVRISFESDGSAFVSDGRGVGLSLRGFYALHALHAGPPEKGEGFDAPLLQLDVREGGEEAGQRADRRIVVGDAFRDEGLDAHYARVSGVDATFAVSQSAVDEVLAAWGGPSPPPEVDSGVVAREQRDRRDPRD